MNQLKVTEVVDRERPYFEISTALLNTIKENLNELLGEEMHGVEEMYQQVIRSTWKMEIFTINGELSKRN
jgi:hypothetical protein